LTDFQQVNLLVGENNCGKTSVLEALFLVTGVSNPQLPLTINQLRGLDYLLGHDKDHLLVYHQLDYRNTISIEAEQTESKRSLRISPHRQAGNDDNSMTIDKEKLQNLSLNTLPNNRTVDGYNYEFAITRNQVSTNYKSSFYPLGLFYHLESPPHYQETVNATLVNPVNVLNQLPQNLNSLIKSKQIKKVVKVLEKIDRSITDIIVGTDNLIYCDTGLSQLVPINVMGDGIRRALSLIVTIANFSKGCVFIDELENGFHFRSTKIIWQAIFEAAKEFDVQIFATTHSMECVSAFSSQNAAGCETRLYRLEKERDRTAAIALDQEMLQVALENNWEIR